MRYTTLTGVETKSDSEHIAMYTSVVAEDPGQ